MEERELPLRIILVDPPGGVDFALQKGGGHDYEAVQTQRSSKGDLHFDFTVRVRPGKDGGPNFLGPFVHGPTGERFIYIDIGTMAGQMGSCWERRLKVPLRGITWEMIEQTRGLVTKVAGKGKDGSPACATVKPFNGWQVR